MYMVLEQPLIPCNLSIFIIYHARNTVLADVQFVPLVYPQHLEIWLVTANNVHFNILLYHPKSTAYHTQIIVLVVLALLQRVQRVII